VMSLRQKMAQKIVIAVPLLPKELLASFSQLADEVVYIYAPQPFYSVGFWYESFPQLTDQEVFHYLQAAKANHLLLPA